MGVKALYVCILFLLHSSLFIFNLSLDRLSHSVFLFVLFFGIHIPCVLPRRVGKPNFFACRTNLCFLSGLSILFYFLSEKIHEHLLEMNSLLLVVSF